MLKIRLNFSHFFMGKAAVSTDNTEGAPSRLLEETKGNTRNLDTILITFVTRVRCVDIVAWNRDVLMLWLVHGF